ncbi:MAG: DUF2806 domain-containing protein [Caulobacteraceae bacterium]|nr:DUF2806 domain-containing protein [Caulobacteraceae bacterium]
MADEPQNAWLGLVDKLSDEGGVLMPLVGRVAAQALTSLVGGVLEVPAAYFGSLAQDIRSDSEARAAIKKAVAAVVAADAASNPAIVDRMSRRWLGSQMAKQQNVEAVARLTFEDLSADPPKGNKPVGSDFLLKHAVYAEEAATDEMRQLFARVLAGEIRKPGSFSLAALHVMSLMDQSLAGAVDRVSQYVLHDFVPMRRPFTIGEKLSDLGRLSDLGLVRLGELNRPLANDEEYHPIGLNGCDGRLLHFPVKWPQTAMLPIAQVTPVGMEVLALSGRQPDDDSVRVLASALHTVMAVGDVSVVEARRIEDTWIPVGVPVLIAKRAPMS